MQVGGWIESDGNGHLTMANENGLINLPQYLSPLETKMVRFRAYNHKDLMVVDAEGILHLTKAGKGSIWFYLQNGIHHTAVSSILVNFAGSMVWIEVDVMEPAR